MLHRGKHSSFTEKIKYLKHHQFHTMNYISRSVSSLIVILIAFSAILNAQQNAIDHWEMLIEAGDDWRYYPATQEPPTDWREISFNDNAWNIGAGGIGYGDNDDLTVIAAVNSLYMRRKFNITNMSVIYAALFYIDYDDAFVAFLNGEEIARGNIGIPGQIPTFDTYADNNTHEAQMYQGGDPESFVLNNQLIDSLLLTGDNVLAIQVHNYGTTSSDLSAIPFLFVGTSDTIINSVLPSWFNEGDLGLATHLPLLSINTNGQAILDEPRIVANLKVFTNISGQLNSLFDTPSDYDGNISIEIRGNSSQMFEKKSYAFETQLANGENNNVSLLGLPEENDWILYGPYSDKTFIRNMLTYQLAREMGWYASRTVFCELVVNENYRGIYILTEKIKRDKNRVDIDKIDEFDNSGDSVTGGYIIKVDWPDDGTNYDWFSPVTNYNGNNLNLGYQYDYPKRSNITNQQKAYIQSYVSSFEQALIGSNYSHLLVGYRKYIDMQSFADHFILNEISNNVDAYRLSNYFTKVRLSKGGKLVAGPVWDFNLGFGNADYGNGWQTYGWALDNPYVVSVIPFHMKRLKEDPIFEQLLRCRWNELRNSVLSTSHINSLIDSVANYLGPAINRNYERWNILGTYVWPNYFIGNTYQEEITYLKEFIVNRVAWMDSNLPVSSTNCQSLYLDDVIITEINYQSGASLDPGDWFEIYNKSTGTINLTAWVVKDENNLNSYTIPYGTLLTPGSHMVICGNEPDFNQHFPAVYNSIGSFNWKLGSNDHIRLFDADGLLVSEVNFDNNSPWPEFSSGSTETLELTNPNANPNDATSWFIGCPGGSPGTEYTFPCPELSLVDATIPDIRIYPNPVINELTINGFPDSGIQYEIVSVDGRVICKGILDQSITSINTADLIPGYYVLKLSGKLNSWTKSFTKEANP